MFCSECGAALHHDAEACPVCGSADGSGTLRHWERSLQAPERETRRAALAALGRIGNVGAVDLLLRTLLREAADRVEEREWEAAATALRATQHPRALRALLVLQATHEWLSKPLERDHSATLCGVRRVEAALDRLFRHADGHARKRQVLLDGLTDPDPRVRNPSAYYLRFHADPEVIDALIAALHDADAIVRERAAEALGIVGVAVLISILHERLHASRRQAEKMQASLATQLEREREVVYTLMKSSLGTVPPIPGLQVATLYEPASQADRVGGDYFDFISLDERRLGVVIGDVCGHGLPAALRTATVKYMLRAYAREDPEPRSVLQRLNRALHREMDEEAMVVTLFYGVLDLNLATLSYTDAGHPPPVLYDPGPQRCRRLRVTGGLVGAFPEMEYRQDSLRLTPGSVLALFTDGVTEAGGTLDPREDARLVATVEEHADGDADALARAIFARAEELSGGSQRDDIAIVVIRCASFPAPLPPRPSPLAAITHGAWQ